MALVSLLSFKVVKRMTKDIQNVKIAVTQVLFHLCLVNDSFVKDLSTIEIQNESNIHSFAHE